MGLSATLRRPTIVTTRNETSHCFEVLVPYFDTHESARRGQPLDTRHSLTVAVWASDATNAQRCARERFRDHRVLNRSAQMAPEGPVALRVLRPRSP